MMNFDAWRHCLRGRLMARLRRFEAAIRAYHDALAADPANLRAVATLGYLYAQRQRYDLAWPYLARAKPPRTGHDAGVSGSMPS